MAFSNDVIDLLKTTTTIQVGTSDLEGCPNVAIKGLMKFDAEHQILYFLDLFQGNTRHNLEANPRISVSAVDYDKFAGYQFKGTAELIDSGPEYDECALNWILHKQNRYRDRIGTNLKRFLKSDVSEHSLPKPKYLVKVAVDTVINLAPRLEK